MPGKARLWSDLWYVEWDSEQCFLTHLWFHDIVHWILCAQYEKVVVLVLCRPTQLMDRQRRLRQSLAVRHQVRRGKQQLLEQASMLVLRHRLARLQQNSQARLNNARTVCEAVIGCRKCQWLSGNSSLRLLLVKGDNASVISFLCLCQC